MERVNDMAKVMVSIRDENFRLLSLEARDRGITIQELIRAVIVPDWVRTTNIPRVRRDEMALQPIPMIKKENEIPVLNRPRP